MFSVPDWIRTTHTPTKNSNALLLVRSGLCLLNSELILFFFSECDDAYLGQCTPMFRRDLQSQSTGLKGSLHGVIYRTLHWFVTDNFKLKCYPRVVQDKSTILDNFLRSLNYNLSIGEELKIDGNFLLFQINAVDNLVLLTVFIVSPDVQ